MSQITKKFNDLSNAECRALSDEERGKLWAEFFYIDLTDGPLDWSVCAHCVNRRECENHLDE
jgi:hypothetical protein